MWAENPAERTLSSLWCSFPWPLKHTDVGRIMLPFVFLPVGLVLEGPEIATDGTAVLGHCLREGVCRRRDRLHGKSLRSGLFFGLIIR